MNDSRTLLPDYEARIRVVELLAQQQGKTIEALRDEVKDLAKTQRTMIRYLERISFTVVGISLFYIASEIGLVQVLKGIIL